MSAHRLIRYPFDGTSIVPFDAYGRSLLRHRRSLLIGRAHLLPEDSDGANEFVILDHWNDEKRPDARWSLIRFIFYAFD